MKKRILILGASGFIGRNLYEYFKEKKFEVYGTYFKSSLKDINKKKLFRCDLRNYSNLESVAKKIKKITKIAKIMIAQLMLFLLQLK